MNDIYRLYKIDNGKEVPTDIRVELDEETPSSWFADDLTGEDGILRNFIELPPELP